MLSGLLYECSKDWRYLGRRNPVHKLIRLYAVNSKIILLFPGIDSNNRCAKTKIDSPFFENLRDLQIHLSTYFVVAEPRTLGDEEDYRPCWGLGLLLGACRRLE